MSAVKKYLLPDEEYERDWNEYFEWKIAQERQEREDQRSRDHNREQEEAYWASKRETHGDA